MDKKTIIGLLVIGVILFAFSWYNSKEQEKLNTERARIDSLNRVNRAELAERAAANATISEPEDEQAKEEAFRQQLSSSLGSTLYSSMTGQEEFYTVENEVMTIKFSNKGGKVASVILKDYKTYTGEPLNMFAEGSSRFNLSLYTNQQINTSDFYFTPVNRGHVTVTEGDAPKDFAMRLYADSVSYIEYVYTIRPDEYMIDYKINFVGMEDLLAKNQPDIIINWETTALQNEKGFTNENNYSTIAYMYPDDDSMEDLGTSSDSNKGKEENINSRIKWVAFKQQFFSSIIIAGDGFQNGSLKYRTYLPNSGKLKDYHAQLSLPYSPSATEYNLQFYFGPNKFKELRQYDLGIRKLVPLGGWLIGWINRYLVIPTFDFLSKYITNYGLIIFLLTVFIKILIFPLTYKSYMSTAKMRVLKPDIEAINAKYPDQKDAMKKQQATMELYKSAGANPMGGCLPLLIQFPFLIAMFRFFPASIELRQQSFLWADDLSSFDSILTLPFDIPFYGSHVSLFTLLMAVSIYISSRISYSQTAAAGPQMAGMKFMTLYLMPVMMLLWFNNYSSGLSYYYLVSNLITLGQTVVFRLAINEDKLHAKMKSNIKMPKKKSKFMERYEQAIKQQQQVQQQKGSGKKK